LKKEQTKYSENSQNFSNFRRESLKKMIQLKNHIKNLILEKEKNKKNYLKVLKFKQEEKEKFEILLKDVKKQRYLSLKISNQEKNIDKTNDQGKKSRNLSKVYKPYINTSSKTDVMTFLKHSMVTNILFFCINPHKINLQSQENLKSLSKGNTLSLCRPFSNLNSPSKRSSVMFRNFPNWGDSLLDLPKSNKRFIMIPGTSSLMQTRTSKHTGYSKKKVFHMVGINLFLLRFFLYKKNKNIYDY
jgi:hypothetical protein